jgi:hypothetical protein
LKNSNFSVQLLFLKTALFPATSKNLFLEAAENKATFKNQLLEASENRMTLKLWAFAEAVENSDRLYQYI